MADLLVVFDDVAEVVATRIVGFAYAHRVVGKIDIAVVAEKFRHFGRLLLMLQGWIDAGGFEDGEGE